MKLCLYSFLLAAVFFISGCATTKPEGEDSDIPWNAPQEWENSPGFFNGQ